MTIFQNNSSTTIVKVRALRIIPTLSFTWRVCIKCSTLSHVLVLFFSRYFFCRWILVYTWIWKFNKLFVTNVYRLNVRSILVFHFWCVSQNTWFSVYSVRTDNVWFITECVIFSTNWVTISATRCIHCCSINYCFFSYFEGISIPCCFLSNNFQRIISIDINFCTTEVSFTAFHNNVCTIKFWFTSIWIWIPSSTNCIAFAIFSFNN